MMEDAAKSIEVRDGEGDVASAYEKKTIKQGNVTRTQR